MNDIVDLIAEAIWRADPSSYDTERWGWLSDDLRDGYRRMAEAAMGAIGLTEEWTNDIAGAAWGRHSRWVSRSTFHPGPHHYSKGH